ncbi:MAG TPA: hypothetical protein VHT68_11845 [Pseudolabrys sp.]|jgi:hypothetical protein|nr:hypothetical protein [Pseudolabrys sp.]
MWIRIFLVPFIPAMLITVGFAQQSNEGAYSCVAESSGGIFYNDQTKKWEGTRFRPLSKFVLRLKYVRTTALGDEYAVSVSPEGKNDPQSCTSHRTQFALFAEPGLLACRTEFYAYRFNLKSGRFVEAYMMGYVNDHNTNDDTPVISGGRCTKMSE